MARLAPFSGHHSHAVVQSPFGFATEGVLSAKLRRVQEKALLSIGETVNNAPAMQTAKELPSMKRTSPGLGHAEMFSVSSKLSDKHSQSAPTLGSSIEHKTSTGSIRSPWATEPGSGWSRMKGTRSGCPPGIDAMEFREILMKPGPTNYALETFDSSFEVDDATGSVHAPCLAHHKRCVGVTRLGSGPEDLQAPRAKIVIEKGAKGLQDRWRPFCLNPGHYSKPDLWTKFSPPQQQRGSRFAAKAVKAEERKISTSHHHSAGAKPGNSSSSRLMEHAIYDTDKSVTCAAPGRTDNGPSLRTPFTAQSKKAANASANQVRRKNAVLLDVSPEGLVGTSPDPAQRACSGLQMGRQHLLIHALIKDMEEMQAEKRRKRMEKQLEQQEQQDASRQPPAETEDAERQVDAASVET